MSNNKDMVTCYYDNAKSSRSRVDCEVTTQLKKYLYCVAKEIGTSQSYLIRESISDFLAKYYENQGYDAFEVKEYLLTPKPNYHIPLPIQKKR